MPPASGTRSEPRQSRLLTRLGVLFLAVGLASSVALSIGALDLVSSMPGCGPGGGCEALTSGRWGTVPGVGLPVSFLGLAYFLVLIPIWLFSPIGDGVRWLVRLSVLYSIFSLGLMFVLSTFCPWCAAAQCSNLLFWVVLERRGLATARSGIGALVAAVLGIALVSSGLMVAESIAGQARDIMEQDLLERNLETMAESAPDPANLRLLEGRHRIGPEDAAVEIVMFTDYQCPDCRRLEGVASKLLGDNPDVSLVVKHFPFCSACNEHTARTIHPNACWAARAAETAALLGGTEGFERMHAWLFERKGSFTDATFPDDLRGLGFDPAEFISMMTSQETLELVRGDTDDARALGVYFTPMIFVNGHEHTWYYGDETSLGQAVVAARNGRSAIPASIEEKLVADWSGRPNRPGPPDDGRRMLGGGPVEIVVFGEYGTEPTRLLDAAVRSMIDAGRPVRYLFRHYPIDEACNELAERFGNTNPGACLDARIVEATELVAGPEARWALHSKLMLPSTAGSDRNELLLELGLPAPEILAAAGSDPRVLERLGGDIDEKVRIWRMHAPILMVDRRFVPRWKHDDVAPERLLELILDTLPSTPTKDDA